MIVLNETFENVGHLADLKESGTIAPGVDDIHHVRLKRLQIFVLVQLQLRLYANLSNSTSRFLATTTKINGELRCEDHYEDNEDDNLQDSKRTAELLCQTRHLSGLLHAHKAAHERCDLRCRQVIEDPVEKQLGHQQFVTAATNVDDSKRYKTGHTKNEANIGKI